MITELNCHPCCRSDHHQCRCCSHYFYAHLKSYAIIILLSSLVRLLFITVTIIVVIIKVLHTSSCRHRASSPHSRCFSKMHEMRLGRSGCVLRTIENHTANVKSNAMILRNLTSDTPQSCSVQFRELNWYYFGVLMLRPATHGRSITVVEWNKAKFYNHTEFIVILNELNDL